MAGKSFKLTATAAPTNASNKAVRWTSSNTKVAAVNSSGTVITRRAGKAVITATASDGSGKTASCTVIVKPKKMTGLTLMKTGTNKIKAAWTKQTGVSGYEIRYSTKSSFSSSRSILVSKSAGRKTLTKLLTKKYYVKIRAYTKVGTKKYYGSFSAKKSLSLAVAK